MKLLHLLLTCVFVNQCFAWDSEQLEVFDLVDEVKQNFYDLLNISKDATSSEIKSAFRYLSLKLHPDKNPLSDTSEQFRNLVSVYDVLRSPTKRKYYNEVLINGLPNWKSAMYYYRYVRKLGFTEVCIILFIIITIGQYLVSWAAYFEEKLTIADNLKKKKQNKKGKTTDEISIDIPKPSLLNTLPFQIPKMIWTTIISIPSCLDFLRTAVTQQIQEATKPKPIPVPEPEKTRVKTVRKRNKFVLPEGPNFETVQTESSGDGFTQSTTPTISGGIWTDDDLIELIRLVKKFPQGSLKRWDNIANSLGRSVPEVTYMANKIKEHGYKVSSEKDEELPEIKVKLKKVVNPSETKWSQSQQKALEEALAKFPKGCTDRWDKIADYVPNKTKEECMLRFKYLAESLKKQKNMISCDNENN